MSNLGVLRAILRCINALKILKSSAKIRVVQRILRAIFDSLLANKGDFWSNSTLFTEYPHAFSATLISVPFRGTPLPLTNLLVSVTLSYVEEEEVNIYKSYRKDVTCQPPCSSTATAPARMPANGPGSSPNVAGVVTRVNSRLTPEALYWTEILRRKTVWLSM